MLLLLAFWKRLNNNADSLLHYLTRLRIKYRWLMYKVFAEYYTAFILHRDNLVSGYYYFFILKFGWFSIYFHV